MMLLADTFLVHIPARLLPTPLIVDRYNYVGWAPAPRLGTRGNVHVTAAQPWLNGIFEKSFGDC